MNDLKHAFRQLRKHPFTNGVIVLTMALLIGAVSVIYASLRHQQARYTPFPEPERLVKLWRLGEIRVDQLFPADLFQDYAAHLASFEEVGALSWGGSTTLTEVGEPVSYNSVKISASLLRIARVAPVKGRIFDDVDESADNPTVLISEQIWREKLGADEAILGRNLRFNDRLHTVVGVLPDSLRSTRLAYNVDVWQPMEFRRERKSVSLQLFARLKPGVSRQQAQAELDARAPRFEQDRAPDENERAVYPGGFHGARLAPLGAHFSGSMQGVPTEMILAWVFAGTLIASVVGIACFNVTNLLLARLAARSRELAIRCALGAGRGRIVRQVLTETVLLAILGGGVGLLVSFWFHELIRLEHANVRLDWRLYAMSVGGMLLLGVLVGLLPAWQSARLDVNSALKENSQTVGGRRRHRRRNFLVASQVAMALILCVNAGLFIRSYLWLQRGDPGFDPATVAAFQVELRPDTYGEAEDRNSYRERALVALREVPGVEAASMTLSSSLMGYWFRDHIVIETGDQEPKSITVPIHYVSQGYAGISGMQLLHGRDFSADAVKAQNEAVVNESFVREHFSGGNPLGHSLRLHGEQGGEGAVIVGVVRDRHPLTTHLEPQAEVLLGDRRALASVSSIFLVQTRSNARPMAKSIRAALQSLDANQPVHQPLFMADLLEQRAQGPRTAMMMLGAIAGLGLFIALMGVYGVVAFTVMERTREVGIRMAVGASRSEVLRLILWQGARLMLLGAIPGLLIGSAVVAMLPDQARLPGVDAFDPLTHLAIVVVVGGAGFLASALPARKAANLNPMEALRYE